MGLLKSEKGIHKCIKCGVDLHGRNWYKHCRKDNWRICKDCLNEKTKEYHRKRKKKNPLRFKVYYLNNQYSGALDLEDLEDLWKSQKGICMICRSKIDKISSHIDHIVPFSKGGTTEIDNLQFLCEKCNRGKFNWSDEEYIEHCKKVAKEWT